ncbi:MAG: STAS domain-containing protein [Candidatus Kapaibacterium sp.]
MFDIYLSFENGIKTLHLSGKIDEKSAPRIREIVGRQINDAERVIALNFALVRDLSHAALKELLELQRDLLERRGELILYKLPDEIRQQFAEHGFDKIFRIVDRSSDIISIYRDSSKATPIIESFDGLEFSYINKQSSPGKLRPVGSLEMLRASSFGEDDVTKINPSDIGFGLGVACVGENFKQYWQNFGEALVINRKLYYSPAAKIPDIEQRDGSDGHYNFLYGLAFSGMFSKILSFRHKDREHIRLGNLIAALTEFTGEDLFGIVMLAKSAGLSTMHLKRAPLARNRIPRVDDIFAEDEIDRWMEFSTAPTDNSAAIIACGVAARPGADLSEEVRAVFSRDRSHHLHALVMDSLLMSIKLHKFNEEINKSLDESTPKKVQHLMPGSRVRSGMIGIVPLLPS